MRMFSINAVAAASLLVLAGCASEERVVRTDVDPGFDMLASQNYSGAEAYFLNEIAEDPNDAYAHLNVAVAQEGQGKFGEAAMHYQHAVERGDGVPVGKTVYNGQVKMENTTVSALAAYNLANLPQ